MVIMLGGAGCILASQPNPSDNVPVSTSIIYYTADGSDVRLKFCNGADMDSEGYKKALTASVSKSVLGKLSTEEKIKTTLNSAAMNQQFDDIYTRIASTTFENGVVTLRPAAGWAGGSIFMCAWKPFVEKNLEQFAEVKSVEWKYATEV